MADSVKLKEIFEVERQYGSFYTGGLVLWTNDGNYFLCRKEHKINVLTVATLDIDRVIGDTDNETEDVIYSFALDSEDRYLLTAHRSGLLKLWEFQTGTLSKTWKSLHQGPVTCIDFHATLNLVATSGVDSAIRIWDPANQICKGALRGGQGCVSVMRFHPNSDINIIMGAADDANILAWNFDTREVQKKFTGHISKVTAISFTHDHQFFVSASRDKVIILWNYSTSSSVRTIPAYESLESLLILPLGITLPNKIILDEESKFYVASAGEEGIIKIWQCNDSKLIYKQTNSLISPAIEEGGLAVTQLLYNERQTQIAVVSSDHNIIVHDLKTFDCCKQLIGFTDEILDLVLLGKKDQYLAMATNSNDIKVYEAASMNCKILKGHTDIVLALSQFKNFLLSSGKDNSIRLWRVDFVKFDIQCIGIGVKHTGAVGSVDFSKVNGNFFASVSQDQCLKLWKLPKTIEADGNNILTLNCINTQLAHEKDINCVTVSPNDRYIATSSQDKTAKLWDANELSLVGVFRGHRRGVWSVRFSPVDQVVVTNAADCTIRLWNLADMSCLKTLEGHESSVLRVEFMSQGMQLLSAGADGLLKMWNIKTSECVQTMDKHENRVWTLAMTQGAQSFYTGGSDSLLIKWKDVTEIKKMEIVQKRQDEILQEQELSNLLNQKKMLKALRLALNLDKPYMTLRIINTIIGTQEAGLEDTILILSNDHKHALLSHAINWNTNSKNCKPAQVVFSVLLDEILVGNFQVVGLNKIIEEMIPYTHRHFKRMTEYMKDLKFIEFTMKSMQGYDMQINC